MSLVVMIEGVSDVRVANEITREVQQVCDGTEGSGQWSVVVSPSATRGQWDLGVRGPFGRYVASLAVGVDQLPALVAGHLRACLGVPRDDAKRVCAVQHSRIAVTSL